MFLNPIMFVVLQYLSIMSVAFARSLRLRNEFAAPAAREVLPAAALTAPTAAPAATY